MNRGMTKKEAKERIKKILAYMESLDADEEEVKDIDALKTAIKALDGRKTGKWFDSANKWDAMANKHNFFCQECKRFAMYFVSGTEDWWCHEAPSYCPHCGAKMFAEEGAEEWQE